jgi:DNA-binding NtrC family response regulator
MEQAEDVQNIIVVDDDECVRETLEIALTGAGHSVRATDCGSEALRWLDDEPCHLLIMDLKMPEIDGPVLYKQVLTRWPVAAPRALFVSGYADLGPYHDAPMLRGLPVLLKPFTLSDLFSAVHRALATSSHVGL